jgi:hypothetical protein
MRENLFNIGKTVWNYANSSVGSAVIGASAAYVLTRGSTEEDLATSKFKLDKARGEISELEKYLKESDSKALSLLQSKTEISSDLQNCLRQKAMLRNAYDNSSCFFRHVYTEESKCNELNERKSV